MVRGLLLAALVIAACFAQGAADKVTIDKDTPLCTYKFQHVGSGLASSGWGACTKWCETGNRYRAAVCVCQGGTSAREVADPMNCAGLQLEGADTKETCTERSVCLTSDGSTKGNAGDTKVGYKVGPWGQCSKRCADADGTWGTRKRTVRCVLNPHSNSPQDVSMEVCRPLKCNLNANECELHKVPLDTEPCKPPPCDAPSWSVESGWSSCKKPSAVVARPYAACAAGSGTRTRTVLCKSTDAAKVTLPDARCEGPKPPTSQPCGTPAGDCDLCAIVGATCSGYGTCTSTGGCSCVESTGFGGPRCDVPTANCASGVVTKADTCCKDGSLQDLAVLDIDGACCTEKRLAHDGSCCSGDVDGCGACVSAGDAAVSTRVLDSAGNCCASRALLDEEERCCAAGYLDACGVCGGDGASCNIEVSLSLAAASLANQPTLDEATEDDIQADLIKLFFRGVDDANAKKSITLKTNSPPANKPPANKPGGKRRRLADASLASSSSSLERMCSRFLSEMSASHGRRLTSPWPSSRRLKEEKTMTATIDQEIARDLARSGADQWPLTAVTALQLLDEYMVDTNYIKLAKPLSQHVSPKAVCGNNKCEFGERCTDDVCANGCRLDCPTVLKSCEAADCSGHGHCVHFGADTSCQCHEAQGYTGTKCDECLFGYVPHNGKCVVDTKANVLDTECKAGRYRVTRDGSDHDRCRACQPGQYQDKVGESSCTKCDAGHYQPKGEWTKVCETCPGGKFQDQLGRPDCKSCPAGRAQAERGVHSGCKHCIAGTYQNAVGQASCKECAVGFYQDQLAGIQCKGCPKGRFQSEKGARYVCELCAAGWYAGAVQQELCAKCSVGKAPTAEDRSACAECVPGRYAAPWGQCVACAQGMYQQQSAQTSCELCSAGMYQDQVSQAACKSCDAAHASASAPTCGACPAGQYRETCGAFVKSPCKAAEQPAPEPCKPCPTGRFLPVNAALKQCNVCAPGQEPTISNATRVCQDCVAGKYSTGGSSSVCVDCPGGQYQPNKGRRACIPCEDGMCWHSKSGKMVDPPHKLNQDQDSILLQWTEMTNFDTSLYRADEKEFRYRIEWCKVPQDDRNQNCTGRWEVASKADFSPKEDTVALRILENNAGPKIAAGSEEMQFYYRIRAEGPAATPFAFDKASKWAPRTDDSIIANPQKIAINEIIHACGDVYPHMSGAAACQDRMPAGPGERKHTFTRMKDENNALRPSFKKQEFVARPAAKVVLISRVSGRPLPRAKWLFENDRAAACSEGVGWQSCSRTNGSNCEFRCTLENIVKEMDGNYKLQAMRAGRGVDNTFDNTAGWGVTSQDLRLKVEVLPQLEDMIISKEPDQKPSETESVDIECSLSIPIAMQGKMRLRRLSWYRTTGTGSEDQRCSSNWFSAQRTTLQQLWSDMGSASHQERQEFVGKWVGRMAAFKSALADCSTLRANFVEDPCTTHAWDSSAGQTCTQSAPTSIGITYNKIELGTDLCCGKLQDCTNTSATANPNIGCHNIAEHLRNDMKLKEKQRFFCVAETEAGAQIGEFKDINLRRCGTDEFTDDRGYCRFCPHQSTPDSNAFGIARGCVCDEGYFAVNVPKDNSGVACANSAEGEVDTTSTVDFKTGFSEKMGWRVRQGGSAEPIRPPLCHWSGIQCIKCNAEGLDPSPWKCPRGSTFDSVSTIQGYWTNKDYYHLCNPKKRPFTKEGCSAPEKAARRSKLMYRKCKDPKLCSPYTTNLTQPSTFPTNISGCRVGHEGPMCLNCIKGWAYDVRYCKECPTLLPSQGSMLGSALSVFLAPIILFIIYKKISKPYNMAALGMVMSMDDKEGEIYFAEKDEEQRAQFLRDLRRAQVLDHLNFNVQARRVCSLLPDHTARTGFFNSPEADRLVTSENVIAQFEAGIRAAAEATRTAADAVGGGWFSGLGRTFSSATSGRQSEAAMQHAVSQHQAGRPSTDVENVQGAAVQGAATLERPLGADADAHQDGRPSTDVENVQGAAVQGAATLERPLGADADAHQDGRPATNSDNVQESVALEHTRVEEHSEGRPVGDNADLRNEAGHSVENHSQGRPMGEGNEAGASGADAGTADGQGAEAGAAAAGSLDSSVQIPGRTGLRGIMEQWKITISFAQVTAHWKLNFDIVWPQEFLDFMANLEIFNLNLLNLHTVACATKPQFTDKFLALSFGPIFFVIFILSMNRFSRAFGIMKTSFGDTTLMLQVIFIFFFVILCRRSVAAVPLLSFALALGHGIRVMCRLVLSLPPSRLLVCRFRLLLLPRDTVHPSLLPRGVSFVAVRSLFSISMPL